MIPGKLQLFTGLEGSKERQSIRVERMKNRAVRITLEYPFSLVDNFILSRGCRFCRNAKTRDEIAEVYGRTFMADMISTHE